MKLSSKTESSGRTFDAAAKAAPHDHPPIPESFDATSAGRLIGADSIASPTSAAHSSSDFATRPACTSFEDITLDFCFLSFFFFFFFFSFFFRSGDDALFFGFFSFFGLSFAMVPPRPSQQMKMCGGMRRRIILVRLHKNIQ